MYRRTGIRAIRSRSSEQVDADRLKLCGAPFRCRRGQTPPIRWPSVDILNHAFARSLTKHFTFECHELLNQSSTNPLANTADFLTLDTMPSTTASDAPTPLVWEGSADACHATESDRLPEEVVTCLQNARFVCPYNYPRASLRASMSHQPFANTT